MESIQSDRLVLRPISMKDASFIGSLFSHTDVRRFYVLRDDHAANLNTFTAYMVNNFSHSSLEYIMQLRNGTDIGLIGGELTDRGYGIAIWNVAYAVIPAYRNNGYATEGLKAFTNYIRRFYAQVASLDISSLNKASEHVAMKCGYKKDSGTAHIDPQHLEDLSVLYHWELELHSLRNKFFSAAVQAFRKENYQIAIEMFQYALAEPYEEGNPNTDALCYSNMGMAYSSNGDYYKAYECLTKAQSLGLYNPSIERDLQWLKNNIGIG